MNIVKLTANIATNLAAKLVYSVVEGYAFLFSKEAVLLVLAAEAVLLVHAAGPQRVLKAGFKTAAACVIGRALYAFVYAAKESTETQRTLTEESSHDFAADVAATAAAAAAATKSIWDWEPPVGDPVASGAWHVLRELVVTATQLQETYPEIASLMSRPELSPTELAARLYHLYSLSDTQTLAESYDLKDAEPVSEDVLMLLRTKRPLASLAYDITTDAELAMALETRGYRLLAARYEPDITSGCPAYYLAMSSYLSEDGVLHSGRDGSKEVVLVLRGTYCPEDVFTDMLAVGVPFAAEGGDPSLRSTAGTEMLSGSVHAGMSKAATFLVLKFGALLSGLRDSGYLITLIGHSLGAGVASLLALQLKLNGFDSNCLRCIAYEPPACMDLSLAEVSADFVISTVHADDVVPRMAVGPFISLLKELIKFDWKTAGEENGTELPTPLAVVHHLAGLFGAKQVEHGVVKAQEHIEQAEKEKQTPPTSPLAGAVGSPTARQIIDPSKYNPYVPGKVVFLAVPPDDLDPQKAVRVMLKPTHAVLRRIRLTSRLIPDHFIDNQKWFAALGETGGASGKATVGKGTEQGGSAAAQS